MCLYHSWKINKDWTSELVGLVWQKILFRIVQFCFPFHNCIEYSWEAWGWRVRVGECRIHSTCDFTGCIIIKSCGLHCYVRVVLQEERWDGLDIPILPADRKMPSSSSFNRIIAIIGYTSCKLLAGLKRLFHGCNFSMGAFYWKTFSRIAFSYRGVGKLNVIRWRRQPRFGHGDGIG